MNKEMTPYLSWSLISLVLGFIATVETGCYTGLGIGFIISLSILCVGIGKTIKV